MKKISALCLTLFILINFYSFSQQRSKINFGAAYAAHNADMQEKKVDILVQGNVAEIKIFLREIGGNFKYSAGDIACIQLKAKHIAQLAEKSFVKRIESNNPYSKTHPMNDSMLVNSRVVAVHAGTTPLTQAYKGKGVVIGFIDTGIDFLHPDFRDSTGKTRIKYLWDQSLPDSAPPQPYNYGREWSASAIDSGKAMSHIPTAQSQSGHGTHVASVACGNGLSTHHYEGVAPEADIIFVSLDFNNAAGHNTIVDAVNYIYAKADSLGEPCVINASAGDYFGSHDGMDLQAQQIKNLITAKNGRSFIASAGNAGDKAFHLQNTATNDTSMTWFAAGTTTYLSLYADTNNFKNVQFAIGSDKITPEYSFRGNIPFSTIASHVIPKSDTIYNGTNRIGIIQSYGDLNAGVYEIVFVFTPDSTTGYNWRLMTTGSGKFDAWAYDQYGLPATIVFANLADSTIFPALKKYTQPDVNQTIVNSFQCLDEVITVGNYINRNQFISYNTTLYKDTILIPGALCSTSSHGPTRDGRIKPDITAPGEMTMACLVTADRNMIITYAGYSVGQGGYHRSEGGTSNASPGVAGIAALYLQKNPGASWLDVKNAIINCARQDTFTGTNLPNNLWGHGKADAFAALTGCSTIAINNNQAADSEKLFTIYPNPNDGMFNVQWKMENGNTPNINRQSFTMQIYNVFGEKIFTSAFNQPSTIHLNAPNGIYFYTLHEGEKIIAAKKLVISK